MTQCELECQDVCAFSTYEIQLTYSGYCSCVNFKILNCYETKLKIILGKDTEIYCIFLPFQLADYHRSMTIFTLCSLTW